MMFPAARGRGFTLIELLVVVVIISLVAAVVIPFLLRGLQDARMGSESSPKISQAAPKAGAIAEEGQTVEPPALESSDIRVLCRTEEVLDGFGVRTDYEARFEGVFVLRNVDEKAERLTLHFQFPPGMSEARDVSLRLREDSGEESEPRGIQYATQGMSWNGPVAPGEARTFVVRYLARGRDAFSYEVAGQGRAKRVRFEMEIDSERTPYVPPDSLRPTSWDGGTIAWSYDELVTRRPIVVEFPSGSSPLGRVILLCQLAGLAVLLFGAGFWYLAELYRPGSLAGFRAGHFLLVALTYSLFFAVFAVVSFQGRMDLGLGLGVAASLPLLTLHVSRVLDRRFALSRALPLAIVTLAVVSGAVYFIEHLSLVLLGAGVGLVAFATLTYRRFFERRKVREKEREAETRRRARQEELDKACAELETRAQDARLALAECALTLDEGGEEAPGAAALRAEVDLRRERLAATLEGAGELRARLAAVSEAPSEETAARAAVEFKARTAWFRERIAAETVACREAAEACARSEREASPGDGGARGSAARPHCSACGKASSPSTAHCPHCGVERPAVMTCTRCRRPVELPRHLLAAEWRDRPLHCPGCGEKFPTAD
ncbi:MAG: zinc ribbon domain-containing protein [Planctomycetes bacterium]|nr:zinc ribbon domain-containing protein [Planctomycetota bacterium]